MIASVACFAAATVAQNVIEDEGVGMSMQELEILVKYWTPEMQQAAANDVGDRFELLSMALANKKIAEDFKRVTPAADPERFWKNQFVIRNLERRLFVNDYMSDLEIPDLSRLAQEMYLTSKEKYALIPESRNSSHILLKCTPPECDVEEKRALAEKILAELQSGAAFEALVEQYSEDPGSKNRGGVFARSLQDGMKGVDPYYVQALFQIEEVGGYSGVVDSTFGLHIIRLDAIEDKSYKPFDEVRDAIIADLEVQYQTLAAKEFDAKYRLSDKAYINKDAMDRIFSSYKPAEIPAP